jgi:hypothetical protein
MKEFFKMAAGFLGFVLLGALVIAAAVCLIVCLAYCKAIWVFGLTTLLVVLVVLLCAILGIKVWELIEILWSKIKSK